MKNMMSFAEAEQLLQLEVAVPLFVGISLLMYTVYSLLTHSGGKGSGKRRASASGSSAKATRRSVRETKKPKQWDDEDEVRKENK